MMLRTSAAGCFLLAIMTSCGSGSVPSTGVAAAGARDDPDPSRDDPGVTRDDPGPGRQDPGVTGDLAPGSGSGSGVCPPCGGSFSCLVLGGSIAITLTYQVASSPTGDCAIIGGSGAAILTCQGLVIASGQAAGTWVSDGQGGVVITATGEGGVTTLACTPGAAVPLFDSGTGPASDAASSGD
jgi:hypothetical protein